MNSSDFIDNNNRGNVACENQNGANANEPLMRPANATAIFEEIASLLDHELPECRMNLVENHANLERVAEYCEVNYLQAGNKRAALDETKDYTTQSLASVAYQINTLAYNFSQLLDLQLNQLQMMESNLSYIAQVIRIHKEKVARREIGILTASKVIGRQHKIVSLPNPEKLIKYVRKPIDFTVLDKIGHGCKTDRIDSGPLSSATGTMKSVHHKQRGTSQSSIQMSSSSSALPAPTTKPPTPPQPGTNGTISASGMKIVVGTGTLGKSAREYRAPPAVAPPQVPSHYAPNYPKKPGYSTLPLAVVTGGVGSGTGATNHSHVAYGQLNVQNEIYKSSRVVPQPLTILNNEQLPPPSQQLQTKNHSPPLPSPPPPPPLSLQHTDSQLDTAPGDHHFMSRSSASRLAAIVPQDADLPGWVPKNFIEKVIAIYDYYADKEDELSFQESAVIYVLKKNDDGWWEGVMDGITGLFPGNYVEPCV